MKTKLYVAIAQVFTAYNNCAAAGNTGGDRISTSSVKHNDTLRKLEQMLPHGSGFDSGIKFDYDRSNSEKLVFRTSFHHMNDAGFYVGWTEHNVIVTPSFGGFDVKVTGRDRNDIKDYISEQMHYALTQEVDY